MSPTAPRGRGATGPADGGSLAASPVVGLIVAGLLVVGLLVVGALGTSAGAGAAGATARFPPTRPTRVLVLGDSVMAGAAGAYGPALPGRDVTIDAAVNRTTRQGGDVVGARGADWDVVVILLGHNDGGSPGVYQPAANRLLDQLAGVPRVVWLTLHEVRPYYAGVNQFLRDAASRRPNLRIADWNALVGAHPEAVAGDGLHLRGAGVPLLAGLVAEQVTAAEHELAPPPTTTTAAPPTTAPPTTTTTAVAVRLIPPLTLDRPPSPTTSTTSEPATSAEPAARTARADGTGTGRGSNSDAGNHGVPAGAWALIVVGTATTATSFRRHLARHRRQG